MKWNKIKDSLPEPNQEVLAIMTSGRMDVLVMNGYQDLFDDRSGNWNIKLEFVSHWAEEPEGPEPE